MSQSRAVVLLSGGLDSTTCLAVATRRDGHEAHALSFRYGQRHEQELVQAAEIARTLGAASHRVVGLDLGGFGGSALTDARIAVPKDRDETAMATEIPVTYVPARNTVFLSVALGLAEVLDARAIYVGVNALDYSGYPDCRPEFLEAFERLAAVATVAGLAGKGPRIEAPLLRLTKADIVRLGVSLGVDYAATLSCYDPTQGMLACGRCDACRLRRAGFAQAGVPDPTRYA